MYRTCASVLFWTLKVWLATACYVQVDGPRLLAAGRSFASMPLGAVDDLSDGGSEPGPTDPKQDHDVQAKNVKPKKGPKASAKPKGNAAKTKAPAAAKKKPAAAPDLKILKRPSAADLDAPQQLPRKANKYWYKKDQKIGIKVDNHEKMTAATSDVCFFVKVRVSNMTSH